MKIPMSWLGRYVNLDGIDAETLCQKLTMMGLEVEGYAPLSNLYNVVVGKIVAIKKHGNADALSVCTVEVGQSAPVQIVTGAKNVAQGDLVPVALDGAVLPGGKTIRAGELRGEVSQGMLCSGSELDIPASLYPHVGEEGILIFGEDHPLGEDIKTTLGIDDIVFDFKITANRPDCQCVLGIARDAAVALGRPLHMPETRIDDAQCVKAPKNIAISVEDAELCGRYVGRIVGDIVIEPSPVWMRRLLFAAGMRPINNIVDITNFVMLELGHPMHAFDLRAIRGDRIIVRRAAPGEMLTTLDEKPRQLDASVLVIADGEGATGLAGIMGGMNSEIMPDTAAILFETAHFNAPCIRSASRRLGIRTESSARFEKGISQLTIMDASDRACVLVQQLGAGRVSLAPADVWPNPGKSVSVTASAERIRRHLSVTASNAEIHAILSSLGFVIEGDADTDAFTATAPPWRLDIEGWADLAEEVLRVYGYDAVPSTLPRGATLQGGKSAWFAARQKLQGVMTGLGFMEISTYSFMSAASLDALGLAEDDALRHAARLLNPMGEEYALMRTTLLPGFLGVMERNAGRGHADAKLYEIGLRFLPKTLPLTELPEERRAMVLGMGETGFFEMKAAVMALLRLVGQRITWRPGGPAYYHPGRKAEILLDGVHLGYAGELHPAVAERFGLRGGIAVAELDLEHDIMPVTAQVKPLPKYPAVTRDLALVVAESIQAGKLVDIIRHAAGGLLEDIALFDVYRSAQVGEGRKSLAFSLTLRDAKATLEEARVQALMSGILSECAAEAGAEIRS